MGDVCAQSAWRVVSVINFPIEHLKALQIHLIIFRAWGIEHRGREDQKVRRWEDEKVRGEEGRNQESEVGGQGKKEGRMDDLSEGQRSEDISIEETWWRLR